MVMAVVYAPVAAEQRNGSGGDGRSQRRGRAPWTLLGTRGSRAAATAGAGGDQWRRREAAISDGRRQPVATAEGDQVMRGCARKQAEAAAKSGSRGVRAVRRHRLGFRLYC